MRPASLQLKLVQRSCLAPSSALSGHPCSLRYNAHITNTAYRPQPCFRRSLATASSAQAQQSADHGVSQSVGGASPPPIPFPGHLKRRGHFLFSRKDDESTDLTTDASAGRWNTPQKPGQLVLGAQHYGKWRELVFDYDRLMFESGLVPAALTASNNQRSVDRPENAGDMRLWSAIFNFAQRRGDIDGALVVWREIFQRRQLFEVEGAIANSFWSSVLGAALEATDETFLESTWAYAEWMHDTHGTLWPHYYRLVISSCFDAGEFNKALQWHMRLSPHFSLSKRAFFDLLKTYITDPNPELQETLRYIYTTSHHRPLYDTIVPLLWSRGHSKLAMAWRETLVWHGDQPLSSSSRPFLQFVAGYYPEVELTPKEQTMANSQPEQYLAPPAPDVESKAPDLPTNIFHLINRVHGETFGIQEKTTFNDKVGAKWFATTWVSLETAINMLYNLGIAEIGPLSLQSIALRSGDPASVVQSLERLEQCQIRIGNSNYSKAIRHFAKVDDATTLNELLQSALHPDVFDDVVLQRQVLGAATFTEDWKTHRLVLAVRLAVSEDALVTTANSLLLSCLTKKRKGQALRLLDEFSARGIEIAPATCERISEVVLHHTPSTFDPNSAPDVDFYAAFCRRLAAQRLPVPAEAWRNILLIYGRLGRLSDLEKVALDIVDQYTSLQTATLPRISVTSSFISTSNSSSSSSSPLLSASDEMSSFKVHIDDVPDIVRGNTERETDLGYRLLPRDLSFDHPLHPLSLIFSQEIVQSTVRWYFHRKLAFRQKKAVRVIPGQRSGPPENTRPAADRKALARLKNAPPSDFSMAGGIRLLAMLRSRGVAVPKATVRSETLICIAALYGPKSMTTRFWHPARAMNQLKLVEVKAFCDAAWTSGDRLNEHDERANDPNNQENYLLPPGKVLKNALGAVRQVATSFGNQITRPGYKTKTAQGAFMDFVSQEWPAQ
ncbi:hypothetical protein SEUCBS139899_006887 [Sporothrix eucalyptigena]|uniref:Pentatricopeptide repeat protein n=1 Tax=Sporothrix eucalyptigena TaxID=1812306 RepID=A0ABP0AYK3_9PEZI